MNEIRLDDVLQLLELTYRFPGAVRDEGLAVVARRYSWGPRVIALAERLEALDLWAEAA